MLGKFIRKLIGEDRPLIPPAPALPDVSREQVRHLWHHPDGLPRMDWEKANEWIASRGSGEPATDVRRAIMAACLDDLRDALEVDHRRWRSKHIEGIAPLEGAFGPITATAAERACKILEKDLAVIRDDRPVPPVAVVALKPKDAYIDYTNSFFPEEGSFATSGGLYHNEGPDTMPVIVICAPRPEVCDHVVAHELTHHALKGMRLPRWAEEGFTQMMEERVTGRSNFRLDAEMVSRHRAMWDEETIAEFVRGNTFISPEDDMQELSYHLSQFVVRGELTRRPKEFFRFAKLCASLGSERACVEALGVAPAQLIAGIVHSPRR